MFSRPPAQRQSEALGEGFQAGGSRLSAEILACSDVAAGEVWREGAGCRPPCGPGAGRSPAPAAPLPARLRNAVLPLLPPAFCTGLLQFPVMWFAFSFPVYDVVAGRNCKQWQLQSAELFSFRKLGVAVIQNGHCSAVTCIRPSTLEIVVLLWTGVCEFVFALSLVSFFFLSNSHCSLNGFAMCQHKISFKYQVTTVEQIYLEILRLRV